MIPKVMYYLTRKKNSSEDSNPRTLPLHSMIDLSIITLTWRSAALSGKAGHFEQNLFLSWIGRSTPMGGDDCWRFETMFVSSSCLLLCHSCHITAHNQTQPQQHTGSLVFSGISFISIKFLIFFKDSSISELASMHVSQWYCPGVSRKWSLEDPLLGVALFASLLCRCILSLLFMCWSKVMKIRIIKIDN